LRSNQQAPAPGKLLAGERRADGIRRQDRLRRDGAASLQTTNVQEWTSGRRVQFQHRLPHRHVLQHGSLRVLVQLRGHQRLLLHQFVPDRETRISFSFQKSIPAKMDVWTTRNARRFGLTPSATRRISVNVCATPLRAAFVWSPRKLAMVPCASTAHRRPVLSPKEPASRRSSPTDSITRSHRSPAVRLFSLYFARALPLLPPFLMAALEKPGASIQQIQLDKAPQGPLWIHILPTFTTAFPVLLLPLIRMHSLHHTPIRWTECAVQAKACV
jgi:hypothetical protein